MAGQFNCHPYSLTSVPGVFTKILKVAMTILRSLGQRMIAYIDNILIMAETEGLSKELILLLENHYQLPDWNPSRRWACWVS